MYKRYQASQVVPVVKNLPANARDAREVGLNPIRKILGEVFFTSLQIPTGSHGDP